MPPGGSVGPAADETLHRDGVAGAAEVASGHGEEQRRPAFHRYIGSGELRGGWAADDGATLVPSGTTLDEVVSSRAGASAYRVDRTDDDLSERRLDARHLGG